MTLFFDQNMKQILNELRIQKSQLMLMRLKGDAFKKKFTLFNETI